MKYLLPFSLFVALTATSIELQAEPGAIVPILDVQSGYLLGGSRGGKWFSPKITAQTLKNGATYRVFSATRSLGTGKATLPKSEGAPCDETLFSKISPDFSKKQAQIALGGAHNPLPRAFRSEITDQPIYRNLVAAILKKNGIAKPSVQITQIWRVDLDGDGAQEVLLTATRKADYGDTERIQPNSRAGDYSLLLLRKLVRGQVKTFIVASEFHPVAKDFNAPDFYRLAAVLDADGDGKMEVLVRGAYYEGEWTSLYSFQGLKPREVLVEGCGA